MCCGGSVMFWIGMIVGAVIGVITMALMVASRDD